MQVLLQLEQIRDTIADLKNNLMYLNVQASSLAHIKEDLNCSVSLTNLSMCYQTDFESNHIMGNSCVKNCYSFDDCKDLLGIQLSFAVEKTALIPTNLPSAGRKSRACFSILFKVKPNDTD